MTRNAQGQYAKGTSGNPGGRKAYNSYAKAIREAVTLGEWGQIINKAIEQAIEGDRWARQFLADYLLGRPVQYVEVADVTPLDEDLQAKMDKVYGQHDQVP